MRLAPPQMWNLLSIRPVKEKHFVQIHIWLAKFKSEQDYGVLVCKSQTSTVFITEWDSFANGLFSLENTQRCSGPKGRFRSVPLVYRKTPLNANSSMTFGKYTSWLIFDPNNKEWFLFAPNRNPSAVKTRLKILTEFSSCYLYRFCNKFC